MIIKKIISPNNALNGFSTYDYQMHYSPSESSLAGLWIRDRDEFLRTLALGVLCLCVSIREKEPLLRRTQVNGTDCCECYASMIFNNPKSDEEYFNKPHRIIYPMCDFFDELSQKLL